MQKTTLSSKGQIIIPKQMRDRHHWRPGTRFVIEDTPDGVLLRSDKAVSQVTVESLRGCITYSGPPITLEEMNAGLDAEFRRQWLKEENHDSR
jgi:AbrB family looped-hinge helix DNA binding protein